MPDVSLDTEMQEFSAAIGELILWANFIDVQLNEAIMLLLVLPEHPLIEPLVSQLDARVKCEILKKRAKLISDKGDDWKKAIKSWVENAEKANTYRNIVAHHHIKITDDKILLTTNQLTKILSNLDSNLQSKESNGLTDIKLWINHSKQVLEDGEKVINNLNILRKKN